METDAVIELVAKTERGDIILLWSSVLDYEIINNPNKEITGAIMNVANVCKLNIDLTDELINRATMISTQGIDYFDALHFACSEKLNADIFVTVDDKLLKKLNRITTHVQCVNPLTYIIQGI
ncbi:MAG: hypothetical protein HYZ54_03960 [Ignavibacteriae bacterium]|nr:hypothetical protein [Ignavibacteriota bacterium]